MTIAVAYDGSEVQAVRWRKRRPMRGSRTTGLS
jgi:hypothetical protein